MLVDIKGDSPLLVTLEDPPSRSMVFQKRVAQAIGKINHVAYVFRGLTVDWVVYLFPGTSEDENRYAQVRQDVRRVVIEEGDKWKSARQSKVSIK